MKQRGRVHELDGGCQLDVTFAGIAEQFGGRQRQHGAQALAARGDEVARDFRDEFDVGAGLGQDQLVHPRHARRGEVHQRLDRGRLLFPIVYRHHDTHEKPLPGSGAPAAPVSILLPYRLDVDGSSFPGKWAKGCMRATLRQCVYKVARPMPQGAMEELIRTNDPVVLSFAEALLRDAGIEAFIADTNMSILEGSLGVLPRRLMVARDRIAEARRLLADAGIGGETRQG